MKYEDLNTRDDGFKQLVDNQPVILNTNEVFRFKCCDCGLTHNIIVTTKEKQPFALGVEQVRDK